MIFEKGKILADITVITMEPHDDERGSFTRTFCEREFADAGLPTQWKQSNHTVTKEKGAIRGMHWQAAPFGESKLIRCLRGRVFDVAVDVRKGSSTFAKWEAFELSDKNQMQILIPDGFAHGFQCLEEDCELLYQMSEFYSQAESAGFRWDDRVVSIGWPLALTSISLRDASLPPLNLDN